MTKKNRDIAEKQEKIDRLKDGIIMDKKLRKIYADGLKKLQEKYPDANTEQTEG